MELPAVTMLAGLAVLALAGFVHGVFGIGFAMIATPMLALMLDYRSAVYVSAVPLLVIALWWLLRNRRHWTGAGLAARLPVALALGALAGVAVQTSLSQRESLLLLAVLLVASVFIPWIVRRLEGIDSGAAHRAAPAFGAMAGVTESALNVGAPFIVLYGQLARLDRVGQLLALNLCFGLGKAIQVGMMSLDMPAGATPGGIALGTAASLLAYVAGDAWAGRFSEETFRAGMRWFLLCMSAVLVARAASM
jgi:uncharacterized membrane protein YfcA